LLFHVVPTVKAGATMEFTLTAHYDGPSTYLSSQLLQHDGQVTKNPFLLDQTVQGFFYYMPVVGR
jgi:hypothetical protein